jgi:hypothetical protein
MTSHAPRILAKAIPLNSGQNTDAASDIVHLLRENRVQGAGNYIQKFSVSGKNPQPREKFRCGDCIRESMPISCSLA